MSNESLKILFDQKMNKIQWQLGEIAIQQRSIAHSFDNNSDESFKQLTKLEKKLTDIIDMSDNMSPPPYSNDPGDMNESDLNKRELATIRDHLILELLIDPETAPVSYKLISEILEDAGMRMPDASLRAKLNRMKNIDQYIFWSDNRDIKITELGREHYEKLDQFVNETKKQNSN